MTTKNNLKSTKIEFHIIQSFPVTCLNRDDVGAPKTAIVGGTTRARVSSQCWKRHIRLAMRDLEIELGTRTRLISDLIIQACLAEGATQEMAEKCGHKVEQIFIKKTTSKNSSKQSEEDDSPEDTSETGKTDTLLFLSRHEAEILAKAFKEMEFDPDKIFTQKDLKKQANQLAEFIGKPEYTFDGLDIALFGRMVAQAPKLRVDGATSFSHAISTHKVVNEVDFFTALDDLSEEPGSAHMGSLEFNSATYYRYISLNVGELKELLVSDDLIPKAIEAFVKALYIAVPSARQSTQAGHSPWEFARIIIKNGQRLQVPFETPIKAINGGFLEPSIEYLNEYIDKKEKLAGSLYGKINDFKFGEDENFNIDKLITKIQESVLRENNE